ncbi:gas vesicle protein [Jiangella sp. DSM 45060]|uniref:gas vesicle protein GvpO n=1 Tax=Jiangella sp. DSM 45060 TaxID=1798224 RepID=UPI00087D4845|nr:gas vesicle protein [Jiangella sp. DSM 45060]SDT45617.1 Gas vesicle synthesis protein GvpO [Jiangella sp. DSM 45060]
MKATEAAERAVEQLATLSGRTAEAVTGIHRTDDGWRVRVEVLELERIPRSTDLLAEYAVDLDEDGDLTGYRRVRRYTRGASRED